MQSFWAQNPLSHPHHITELQYFDFADHIGKRDNPTIAQQMRTIAGCYGHRVLKRQQNPALDLFFDLGQFCSSNPLVPHGTEYLHYCADCFVDGISIDTRTHDPLAGIGVFA